jgi:hypothetical protein
MEPVTEPSPESIPEHQIKILLLALDGVIDAVGPIIVLLALIVSTFVLCANLTCSIPPAVPNSNPFAPLLTFKVCPAEPIDNGVKLPLAFVTNTLLLPALATASATPLAKNVHLEPAVPDDDGAWPD